ncbi:endolytic transglycosylase MltG [Scopulibacillus cellulosilyticus]|uniref:Endolytic murein transglycosylase n=1 Tax=Scopulibacillus cellulosilyticus TaxID=2665665 RepID=A0ABW2PZQ1_9BACL
MSKSDDQMKLLNKQRKGNRLRRFGLIVVIVLIILIAAAVCGIFYVKNALAPVDKSSAKKVTVQIPSGTSSVKIGQILKEKGIINNASVFRYYAKYKNESNFKAGTYLFSPSMSTNEIIQSLNSGRNQSAALQITVPEGWWVKDIAHRIAQQTNLNEKDILNKMQDRNYIKQHYMKDYPFLTDEILNKQIKYPLEGYLFPATYRFSQKNPSLDTIIKAMLDKTQDVLGKYQKQINNNKLGSVHKILTMASLLEGEAQSLPDLKKVSGVFYNRLDKGMPLQTDPTIAYAKQKHLYHTTYKDLDIKSPYNTYKNKGLPVGPINNPGEEAIEAVLNPIKSDDLYFFARPNGEVIFTKTLKEHHAVVKKYGHEWDKIKS